MKKLSLISILWVHCVSMCVETIDPISSHVRANKERTALLSQISNFFDKNVAYHNAVDKINDIKQSPSSLTTNLIAYFVLPKHNVEILGKKIAQKAGLPYMQLPVTPQEDLIKKIDTFFKDLEKKAYRTARYSEFIPVYSIIIVGTQENPISDAELIAIYQNPEFRPADKKSSRFNQVYIKKSGNL